MSRTKRSIWPVVRLLRQWFLALALGVISSTSTTVSTAAPPPGAGEGSSAALAATPSSTSTSTPGSDSAGAVTKKAAKRELRHPLTGFFVDLEYNWMGASSLIALTESSSRERSWNLDLSAGVSAGYSRGATEKLAWHSRIGYLAFRDTSENSGLAWLGLGMSGLVRTSDRKASDLQSMDSSLSLGSVVVLGDINLSKFTSGQRAEVYGLGFGVRFGAQVVVTSNILMGIQYSVFRQTSGADDLRSEIRESGPGVTASIRL